MNNWIFYIAMACLLGIGFIYVLFAMFNPPTRTKLPPPQPKPEPSKLEPHWEAVPDEKECQGPQGMETMWRIRWSEVTNRGWFYVRHYGGNGTLWNKHAAQSQAEQFNREKRTPQSFLGFHEMPLV